MKTLSSHEAGALAALMKEHRNAAAEQHARALLATHPGAGLLWKVLGVALMRQGKDAIPALRRAAELMPGDPETHCNLGAALHDQKQWLEALASLERGLAIEPKNVEAMVDAANALRELGRAKEAINLYDKALQLEPGLVDALNNLGNTFLAEGKLEHAAGCYHRALANAPNEAQIMCNLGNVLRQIGRFSAAMTYLARAIELDPNLSVAHNNLGLVFVNLGQRAEAVECFVRSLQLNPDYAEAFDNLGSVLCDLGRHREAPALYARAIEIEPSRAETHCNLGNALFELRRLDEAVACYERALALRPTFARAHVSLAAALRLKRRFDAADASVRMALSIEPDNVDAICMQGELHADRGNFKEALQLFQRAVELAPDKPLALLNIAAHRKMTPDDDAWLAAAKRLLSKPLPVTQEVSVRFALGKYFDDLGSYDQAFENYRLANELSKSFGPVFIPSKLTERVDRIIHGLDAAFVRKDHAHASDSQMPIFVVGMPRSGTSLTEQILASHPSVFGAGEMIFWDAAYNTNGPNVVPGVAADYLARLKNLAGEHSLRVVDKMPANFMYAGLIHAVFPRARIIHMTRHPVDTCLSIYFQHFYSVGPYANDLESLAHYYTEYARLMAHWRSTLPEGALLEIPYEGLINDQELWTRRMLAFVGLPWDARCLEFHETDRVVITASKWQVRQKITASSTGRWKKYRSFIGPLERLARFSNDC